MSCIAVLDLARKEVKPMDTPFYRKPIPAVAIAVGIGILAIQANANAAQALGVRPLLFGAVLALLLAALGFRA